MCILAASYRRAARASIPWGMGRLIGVTLALATLFLTACGAPVDEPPAAAPLTDQDRAFLTRAERAHGQALNDPASAVEYGKTVCDIVTSSGPVSPQSVLPAAAAEIGTLGAEAPGAIAGAGYAVYCPDYESQINWIKTRTTDG